MFYATEKGAAYHRDPECPGLRGGQRSADVQGNEARPVREFATAASAAAHSEQGKRCGTCLPEAV